jgi:signal transduction histidine kinase/ActR/RegA family two-component response regulator/HAMP domain-containing protein
MGQQRTIRPSAFLASVRARLLIAFSLMIIVSLGIGSIGWRGFSDTKHALDSLSEESLPDISRIMELARTSASVASVAPFIGSLQVMTKLESESVKLREELSRLRELVRRIEPLDGAVEVTSGQTLTDLAGRLEVDLLELVDNTRQSLGVRGDMLERQFAFGRVRSIEERLAQARAPSDDAFDRFATLHQIVELILTAEALDSPVKLDRSETELRSLSNMMALDMAGETDALARDVALFLESQADVHELRRRELAVEDKRQYLLASILTISKLFSERVSAIVTETTDTARARSFATNQALDQGSERIAQLTFVALALASLAGAYVVSLFLNLQSVTSAMTRLAGGDRQISVPAVDRPDELGDLARAFNIFKVQSFEREALAGELIEKSRTLEAAFENMTDGLSVFDMNGALLAWNPQFIALNELDPASIRQGVSFQSIFAAQQAAGVQVTSGGTVIQSAEELIVLRQNGQVTYEQSFPSRRLVELRSRPMDGGFATIYTDQTDRRAYEERIRSAQRMEAVGQLTSGLAHDFNNLLATVSGNLEMLDGAFSDRPEQAQRVLRALHAAERGAEVTQRLLAFSRQQALQPETTDINALITSLLELLDFDLGDKISIRTELDPHVGHAVIDPAQLENAILNLIFNARDAMPNGGLITISTFKRIAGAAVTDQPDNAVCIAVEDTGMGMSAQTLSRVYEPFFSTKDKGQGTGLGLSMVYGFVVQSGGDVQIASEEGKGTTVNLWLPQSQVSGKTRKARRGRQRPSGPPPRGNETVLVVEDDAAARATAADMLEGLGYRVLTASGLAEAKAEIERNEIDLLFTDYQLTDSTTGDDIVRIAQAKDADIAVLYTSGYPRERLQHSGSFVDDAVLLAKPYKKRELAEAVRQQLDKRQSNPKRSTLQLSL